MDNSYCREIQLKLLDMLHWFHDFCVSHGLRYYALGGTMLGAVRHCGFIPWDDDLDVGMPRQDYETLKDLLTGFSDQRYILETPNSTAPDYNYCYSKLYDTGTTLVENTRYKTRRGISMDVFPLDGIGNSEQESKEYFRKIDRKFNLIIAHTTGIRQGSDQEPCRGYKPDSV